MLCVALAGAAPPAWAEENANEAVTALVYAGNATPTPETTTVGALEAGCPIYTGPNIELYQPDGSLAPSQQVSGKAWTLAGLLGCLQPPIPLAAVTGVTVIGALGPELSGPPESSQLSPADLGSRGLGTQGSDFEDPAEYPVLYNDGTGLIYDRPWRGPGDANADDEVVLTNPSPFEFEVFEGPPLSVSVSASAGTVRAGATISFSAQVSGEPAGSPLDYTWDFDGVAPSSAANAPSVTFASAGRYTVTLQVSDAAGGGGAATIPITVSPGTTTTTKPPTAHATAPTGPQHSSGTQPGATPGSRRSGSATRTTTTSSPAATRPAATAPPTTSGAATTTTSSTVTPATSLTSTATASAGIAGSSGTTTASNATTTATVSSTPAPRHLSTAARRRTPRPGATATRGVIVDGSLIGDLRLVAASISPLVHATATTAASARALRRPAGSSEAATLGTALGAILLFGLGAGRELRAARGRRRSGLHD